MQSFRLYYENSKLNALKSFIDRDNVLSINDPKDISYFTDSKHLKDSLNRVVQFVYNFEEERIEEHGVTSSKMFEIDEHTDAYLEKILGKPIEVYRDYLWAIRFKDRTNILIHTPNLKLLNPANIGYIEVPYDVDKNSLFSKLSRLGIDKNKLNWLEWVPENTNSKFAAFSKFHKEGLGTDLSNKILQYTWDSKPINTRVLYDLFKGSQDYIVTLYGRKSFSYEKFGESLPDDYAVEGEILEVKPEGVHILWSKINPRQAFKKAEEGDEIFVPFKDLVAHINYERRQHDYDHQAYQRGEWG